MVINLDLDQFDNWALYFNALKEIIAYYSAKKISGRSEAALKLKTRA